MYIGQEVRAKPEFSLADENIRPDGKKGQPRRRIQRGRIIYIHPELRFVTVEFRYAFGSVRECFLPGELIL